MVERSDAMDGDDRNDDALAADVEAATILVVDDMLLMRQMIGVCLRRGGFSNLTYAEDGEQALEMVAAAMPDLIVLDLNMPRLSGYEVCRRLRADPATAKLPILVQSASETAEERVEVFASGATDFVSKPINQPELLARVRMHLENRFLIKRLSSFHERMQAELAMARGMQHSLLPEDDTLASIAAATGVRLEAVYEASFELGGDLWGCWLLPGRKLGLYVLDISGHGVSSALNTFRVHATMGRFGSKGRTDPAQFLSTLNGLLQPHFPVGQFATMFYGVLDCQTGDLKYAGAGAPRPMIVGQAGVRHLDSSGLPIGALKAPVYENRYDRLEPGESLFCYSDVLTEAAAADGSFLGEDGLTALVRDTARTGQQTGLVGRLLAQFFADRSRSLPDDLTAVAVHRPGDGES